MPKSRVSNALAALEERLGVPLLVRTTRKLSLTDVGRSYYERVRGLVQELEAADVAVASHAAAPRGLLRLSAPLSFGMTHVVPLLLRFLSRYPEVEVDADFTDRVVDLVHEGIDVAVRIGVLPDSTLIAQRLVDTQLVVCASMDYLQRRGTPLRPEDLAAHDCLLYRHSRGVEWRLRIDGKTVRWPVAGRLRSTNGEVLREAALKGLGLAQLPTFIVGADIAAGRLRRVLDDCQASDGAAYVVYPRHRQPAPAVRAFADMLREQLSPHNVAVAATEGDAAFQAY